MGLLAPLFLAVGAVALAIPVLVHLIHRERSETIAFPSLMFLQRIPYRSVRRQKIRHWLLFLLRCAALVLLATAFARPFFQRDDRALGGGAGGRELVILLDQSYSMGYRDHWQRALAAAHRAVDGMGSNDKATIVLFSDEARAVNRATGDRAALAAALDTTRVTSRSTRYGTALKMARTVLEESRLPRREVVLITDFQKAGWTADESSRLPNGTTLTRVDLSDPGTSNLTVTSVSFQRDYPEGRERVLVSARMTNKGAEPARGIALGLELSGREIQSRKVDLGSNSAAAVTFAPFLLPEGTARGSVRAAADWLPADNAFHFTLAQGQALSVLIVEPSGGTDRSLYLRRALAVGDHPAFRTETRRTSQLTQADLAGRSLVILDDAGIPTPDLARLLQDFVTGGGGLLVVAGERTGPGSFASEATPLLPATTGGLMDRATISGGKLTRIDYSHPVFELFSAPRSGDFSGARFFRYRRLETRNDGQTVRRLDGQTVKSGSQSPTVRPSDRPTASVLASFDDGSPALVESALGKGKVLVWASTLDNYWSDFAVQPVFLPFLHQLAKYGAGYTEAAAWHTVGEAVDVGGTGGRAGGPGGPGTDRSELVAVS
ncbi:MAG: BatA domain-containing protein, partial [Gemmatimonadetes bacterium]|nr:BatA domain-containing protein [Gemmatimonadota bacterium]